MPNMNTNHHALILDDDDLSNLALKEMLLSIDLFDQVSTHTSLQETLDTLSNLKQSDSFPDIIFLDIHLKNDSGFDFIEKLMQLEVVKTKVWEPSICLISSHMRDPKNYNLSDRYRYSGVIERLQKPIELEEIEELVEDHFMLSN